MLKLIIAGVELFAIITTVFGRISFCMFLLYIISPTDTAKRRTLYGVIGVQVAANLVCLIQIYAQCGSKVEAMWNFSIAASAHCQSPMVQTIVGYGKLNKSHEARLSLTFCSSECSEQCLRCGLDHLAHDDSVVSANADRTEGWTGTGIDT